MERLTVQNPGGYTVPAGKEAEAIERLAKFENLYEAAHARVQDAEAQLDKLRAADKQKTHRYKELWGGKIMAQDILNMFKVYGLED